MSNAPVTKSTPHPLSAEGVSILGALILTVIAVGFFLIPNYSPEHNWPRGLPGWIALAYVTIQLWMLLHSAIRVRPTSVIDAAVSIIPVVAALVCAILALVGTLNLSAFQWNALAMLFVAALAEFMSTLWVRNVVLQRGVTMMPGNVG